MCWVERIKVYFATGILFLLATVAYGDSQHQSSQPISGIEKVFEYTGTKFGVPFLKATIKIEDGSLEEGRSLFQVHAVFHSLEYLGFLFRMNNRFTSTIEAESCSPVRYVKEVDQEGLLIEKKSYLQTLTFDSSNQKVVVEKKGGEERQEVSLPSGTYDPLSMFARCYLKEELHPGQDIHMSIYDGVKLRQLTFHSRKEKVKSKMYGKVEAVRLESSTSFSSFGDREGTLRIWYLTDGGKTPILIELELPIGKVKFELESVYGS